MRIQSFAEHLHSFGIRVGSSPRKFGLYGNADGSDVSAADAVSLHNSDSSLSDIEDAVSSEALPLHQHSPAHLIQSECYQEHLASKSQTHQDVLRTLRQLEAYKTLSKADPATFRRLWQQPLRQRKSTSANRAALAIEMLGSLVLSCLLLAAILLHLNQVCTAIVAAFNLLQIWAWADGTSLFGRMMGLWWEESTWKHAAPTHLVMMAGLADLFYTCSTLGLGGRRGLHCAAERGLAHEGGSAFYRPESAQARDLAVLAVRTQLKASGAQKFRVLDALAGSGIRTARYLQQISVTEVWSNDINPANREIMLANASASLQAQRLGDGNAINSSEIRLPGLKQHGIHLCAEAGTQSCLISSMDASKVLLSTSLAENFWDLVDVDSFGSQGELVGHTLGAVKLGGWVYLTSTDGLSAGAKGAHP
ncbi:hypothetical protein WJX74_001934 [Apatococcus lobatus]|uniref:Uncharacterized protein n=1 Tax=Apatococcus lobatus TaxID=904363 RepID=A0AAW1R2X0_9CHLO